MSMDWNRHRYSWPNAECSRFLNVRPHRWHVQIAGRGPVCLLLHGTGATTHSWRDLLPRLARHFTVVAPDLPGHGFTRLGTAFRSSLPLMATDLWALVTALETPPDIVVGHSAGAALALQMARTGPVSGVIGLNAALAPFDGAAGFLFPTLARSLALNPVVPSLAARALDNPSRIESLIRATGSHLDPVGLALYRRVASDPHHVRGALEMMSRWSPETISRNLTSIAAPAHLLTADRDRTVPPSTSENAVNHLRNGHLGSMGPLGHLAHEEDPDQVAATIIEIQARLAGLG